MCVGGGVVGDMKAIAYARALIITASGSNGAAIVAEQKGDSHCDSNPLRTSYKIYLASIRNIES